MRPTRIVLLLFLATQLWDGIFTWVAVDSHKLGAAAGGVLLYVRGVHGILAGLTLFYAVGAIGPWLIHYGVI